MVTLNLKDNENGYSKVEEYVKRYWGHNGDQDVIVSVEASYDSVEWRCTNEIASPYQSGVEWLNDWWEGEKYIRLHGIQGVDTLDVSGGLYEEDDF